MLTENNNNKNNINNDSKYLAHLFFEELEKLRQENEKLSLENIRMKKKILQLEDENEQRLAIEEELKQFSEIIFQQKESLATAYEELEIKTQKISDAYTLLQQQEMELKHKNDTMFKSELVLKKAFTKLKEKEQLLLKVNEDLENLSIVARETENAISIYERNGKLIWFNEGFTKLYGYNFEDYIKKVGDNIFMTSVHPDIINIFDYCIENRKSTNYQIHEYSITGREIWSQITLSPIVKEDKVVKIVAIESDIRKIKRAEIEIENQKILLENQNEILKMQYESINASIRYAQTLQQTIFPDLEKINEFKTFLIFRPKNIVSGDFYWYSKIIDKENKYFYFAVVDCTGHGVPGAFMSLVGNSLLNEIINVKRLREPSLILHNLNKKILRALKQKFNENTDGMDIAIVRLQKKKVYTTVTFAAAKRPLFYYLSYINKLAIINGTRRSIGGISTENNTVIFENHTIELSADDCLYLSSDGYVDQNAANRKRLGTPRLQEILITNAQKDMEDQKKYLEEFLFQYMQDEEQRDDITIFGIKLV